MSDRREALLEVGCLCCLANLRGYRYRATGSPCEEHHLNAGGIAGQARRGEDATVPLCAYHHRGVVPAEVRALGLSGTREALIARYGPSWAHGSKAFRDVYPGDDALLAEANERAGLTG